MIEITNAQVSLPSENLLKKLKGALFPGLFEKDREPALHDITLWLGRGESWGLLGTQDAGKTTLLRLIAGLIPPDSGSCRVEGPVFAVIEGEMPLLGSETGEGNVRLLGHMQGLKKERVEAQIEEVARISGLGEAYFKPMSGYDECMRARLALSMALSAKPALLVIGNMLERCTQPYLQAYVEEIRRMIARGMTLIMESEDVGLMARLCESAIWMQEGKLKQLGVFETVYEAYAFKRVLPFTRASVDAREWLLEQQAAFSEPLSPRNSTPSQLVQGWPKEAQRVYRDQMLQLNKLQEQTAAFAQANLAFERENTRLQTELQAQQAQAERANQTLADLLDAVSGTLRVMHAQFRELAPGRKQDGDSP